MCVKACINGECMTSVQKIGKKEEWGGKEYGDKAWIEYRRYTNCYAYAFNLLLSPPKHRDKFPEVYGGKFPLGWGLLPGVLCGDRSAGVNLTLKEREWYFEGSDKSNLVLIDLVKRDMCAAGITVNEESCGVSDEYTVALAIKPKEEWHWYRKAKDGTWSHKQGQPFVTRNLGYITAGNKLTTEVPGSLTGNIKKDAEAIGYTYVRDLYVIHNR